MEILFIILKIIGIILAFLLFLCITLILVPVRYRVNLNLQDAVEGKAVIHWLLHLVDVRIYYKEKDISFKLRIFGIPLPLGKKKEKGRGGAGRIKKGKKAKNIPDKAEDDTQAGQEDFSEDNIFPEEDFSKEGSKEKEIPPKEDALKEGSMEREVPPKEDALKEGSMEREIPPKEDALKKGSMESAVPSEEGVLKKGSMEGEGLSRKGKHSSAKKKKGKQKAKKSFWEKRKADIYNFNQSIQAAVRGFGQLIEDVRNGTTTVKEQIARIRGILSEESSQNAFFHVLREVRYLLRHYIPGTISGNVTFSMGNPEQTGKALGAVSFLPFWARSKLVVMPDFLSESFYAKGIVYVAGHMRFLHIPVVGIRLIADKNIRKFITNIRK